MLPSPKEEDASMKQDPLSHEDVQKLKVSFPGFNCMEEDFSVQNSNLVILVPSLPKTAAASNGLYFLKAVAYNSQNEGNTRTATSFVSAVRSNCKLGIKFEFSYSFLSISVFTFGISIIRHSHRFIGSPWEHDWNKLNFFKSRLFRK